jgi:signal transduction histidine kinase
VNPPRQTVLRLNQWTLLAFAVFCAVFALWLARSQPFALERYVEALLAVVMVYGAALLAVVAAAGIAPARPGFRALVLGLAAALGVLAGHHLAVSWSSHLEALLYGSRRSGFALVPFIGIAWLGVAWFLMAERDSRASEALFEAQLQEAELRRAVVDARYAVLQAQVEPHFLFNTLAHVRRLYAIDPVAGRMMMRNLRGYLGDTRPAMQRDWITLGEDLRLAEAYLGLQKVRMGERLVFVSDVPADMRGVRVPPMALTTLVENAVRHGLSSQAEGGEIHIRAERHRGSVQIEVADTGRGLVASHGSGLGLSNLRARLTALHGPNASLALRARAPHGAVASVCVPDRAADVAA